MKLRWSRSAIRDLDLAFEFLDDRNPGAAVRTIDRIEAAAGRLRSHPEIGRPGRVDGTRELVVPTTPYILAYRIEAGRIEILAVIHGARKWPERF